MGGLMAEFPFEDDDDDNNNVGHFLCVNFPLPIKGSGSMCIVSVQPTSQWKPAGLGETWLSQASGSFGQSLDPCDSQTHMESERSIECRFVWNLRSIKIQKFSIQELV